MLRERPGIHKYQDINSPGGCNFPKAGDRVGIETNFKRLWMMKRVSPLTDIERQTLEAGYRYGPTARFRQRCHSIVLSAQGYSVSQLSQIFSSHFDTVSGWLDRWERWGIAGLYDGKRSGRPMIYEEAEIRRLPELIAGDPRQLKAAKQQLEEETGKRSCLKTLQRALKKDGLCMEALSPQSCHSS